MWPNGTLVRIKNLEHVWYGEIAIVRDSRPAAIDQYRVELLGGLIWMPATWLEEIVEYG